MRRWLSIAEATAQEMLSEPLSLLLLWASLALVTLAPAFHYHQFGEATRMARDAGLSSLMIGGLLMGVVGTVRSLRRELESGTAQMVLAHPISRMEFFLSKVAGATMALAVFDLIITAVSLTIVRGAEIGGIHSDHCGSMARIWGPSLVLGLSVVIVPMTFGAILNWWWRWRFVPTCFWFALAIAIAGVFYQSNWSLVGRMVPAILLSAMPAFAFLIAAAAFAVRWPTNRAVSAVSLLAVALLPFAGNYYLSDALSKGGAIPWLYTTAALLAGMLSAGLMLILGIRWMNSLR